MEKIVLNVKGMSCLCCVGSIEEALNELEGVSNSKIELDNNTVEVVYDSNKIELNRVKEVIVDQGYQVVS